METILLIGGLGFIGSHVARALVNLGYQVVIFDLFVNYISPVESIADYGQTIHDRFAGIEKKVTVIRGDARYFSALVKVVDDLKPDRIVHFGAMPISTLSNVLIGEAIDSTIVSTSHILEIVKDRDFVSRFLYISSSMVYGDFLEDPCGEDHPKQPKDVYGAAKLCGEILTQAYSRRFGIKYTIVRPSAVYGPTDMNKRISQIIVENALTGKETTIRGGDEVRLDFTNVNDAANGIVLALLSDQAIGEIFNITSGHAHSLREFVELVREFCPDMKVKYEAPDKTIPLRGTLSIEKARRLLNFAPKYCLRDGIKEYFEYAKRALKGR